MGTDKEMINLRSLSLARYEENQRNIQNMINDRIGVTGGAHADTLKKLIEMEEENARQVAKLALKEKKMKELEEEKNRLEPKVQRQNDLLQQILKD